MDSFLSFLIIILFLAIPIIKILETSNKKKSMAKRVNSLKNFSHTQEVLGYDGKFQGGIGLQILKWFQWRLDAPIFTNKGVYAGVSYKIQFKKIQNSSFGIGYGIDYKSRDKKILFYYKWEF